MWKHFINALPLTLVAMLLTAITVLAAAGTTDAPAAPGSTSSYTLEDIYQRLANGIAGAQSAFTEPSVAPGTGTMHDVNALMAAAPALDDTNGAAAADVLSGDGSSWRLYADLPTAGLLSLSVVNASDIWAVGNEGYFVHYMK